jgi:2,4-diaminopentanoate dehydrogenase
MVTAYPGESPKSSTMTPRRSGREAIIIEHVNRWRPTSHRNGARGAQLPVYRIRVEREPDIGCDTTGAMVSTAMRVVNAVPYVVEAKPGLLSVLDLSLTLPRNVLR